MAEVINITVSSNYIVNGSTIVNGATITSTGNITFQGNSQLTGNVTNDGTISGGYAKFNAEIINNGTISGTPIDSPYSLKNSSVISNTSNGILTGRITNYGTIEGGHFVGAAINNKTDGILTGNIIVDGDSSINGGTITSTGNITFQENSLLTGNVINNGILNGGYAQFNAEITNNGTISGTPIDSPYSLTNSSVISNTSNGILTGKITNSGTIEGGHFVGAVINNTTAGILTGNITVDGDSRINGGTITSTGNITFQENSLLTGNVINNGTINGGYAHFNAEITNNGTINGSLDPLHQLVISGNITDNGGNIGGYIKVVEGGSINGGTLLENTTIYVSNGSISNIALNNTNSVVISSGGMASNITVNNNGYIEIQAGGTISGNLIINQGGQVKIDHQVGGNILIEEGKNTTLTITGLENGGSASTVINDFSGNGIGDSDIITLAGVDPNKVTKVDFVDGNGNANGDYITFTLTNEDGSTYKITLNIIGIEESGYNLGIASDGSLMFEVCFLPGSMIRTPNGEIAVEDLRIGDHVYTYDWAKNQEVIRRVSWVGNKTTVVKPGLPDDEAGYPVRVLKDAISEGVPHKDLLITSEHCLFFDDKFVPVRMLVNGSSIFYDHSITEYTYYHIETEEHSVIWADGMLTESYLDTGNRITFKQHGDFVIFINKKQLGKKSWGEDANAPLVVDRLSIEPLYNQLTQRALDIGFDKPQDLKLTNDPDFHLVSDKGDILQPSFKGKNKYSFVLPEDVNSVYLDSKTSRPCDTIGPFVDDRRSLGVLVGNINIFTMNENYQITEHLTDRNLPGWDVVEASPCRWTNGSALLHLPKTNKKRVLIIETLSSLLYYVGNETITLEDKKIAA